MLHKNTKSSLFQRCQSAQISSLDFIWGEMYNEIQKNALIVLKMCVWANISKERAMKKKILSLILTLCLLLGAFPFVVGTSAADAITADIEISTADQLVEQLMDPENAANWSKTIVLTADIDLATYTGTKAQAPIGNSTTAFTGTFDLSLIHI